jgi:hypothetical protein
MRTAVVGVAVVLLAAVAGRAPAEPPAAYSSPDGNYKVRFPGAPKTTTKTADTQLGELAVGVATYANSDGNVYMVSYTDFPHAPKPQNLKTLFDGVKDGVKGNGKLVGEEKELTFGAAKLPGREFVVEKGKQQIKLRAILSEGRLYQIAVIGTDKFVTGKDANLFFESFEIPN